MRIFLIGRGFSNEIHGSVHVNIEVLHVRFPRISHSLCTGCSVENRWIPIKPFILKTNRFWKRACWQLAKQQLLFELSPIVYGAEVVLNYAIGRELASRKRQSFWNIDFFSFVEKHCPFRSIKRLKNTSWMANFGLILNEPIFFAYRCESLYYYSNEWMEGLSWTLERRM